MQLNSHIKTHEIKFSNNHFSNNYSVDLVTNKSQEHRLKPEPELKAVPDRPCYGYFGSMA